MTILEFPPIEEADDDGLLAIGGDLEIESLLCAYRSGIFPWPLNAEILAWFSPPERAVLFLDELHVSRSLAKRIKKADYEIVFDRNFEAVIRSCAKARNRKGQRGTWITEDMIMAYISLFEAGFCHSIECYQDNRLAGGLYGVSIGHFFAGESMFHSERDASKLCLVHLVQTLAAQGVTWLDCQVMTPLLGSFGACEIERSRFLELLNEASTKPKLCFTS